MMAQILDGAWRLVEALNFGGIAVALAGIGTFGWTFVKVNALAARGDRSKVPPSSWRGKPARMALVIFASGVAMQVFGYALGALLPFRT